MVLKKYVFLFSFLSVLLLSFLISCNNKEDIKLDNSNAVIKYAEITNARIGYKVYGSGDPLIMCTGYATNMDLWSTGAIDLFQKNYKVIVFDYRGMGLSSNSDTSFSISSLAEDLNELLDKLSIEKADVLGWSMGGYVAQMFAISHPEKINKLILYATDCGDTITINPSQEIINILSNPNSTPEEMLSTLFPDDWLANHPEPWKVLPDAKEPYNSKTIGMQYYAVQEWLSPGGGSAGKLFKLKMPVLLICGDQDKVVPCENSSILSDSISSASLVKVNDCGHGMMYQIPETFSNYVLTFLAE